MIKALGISLVLATLGTASFAADPAVGTWKTQPDRKDLVSHIVIRECGPKLCGKIKVAFDKSGKEVVTKNIGKELFWDMVPAGSGNYSNGTVWVPLLNVKANATMKLAGNKLTVEGCKLGKCDGQTWTRVK